MRPSGTGGHCGGADGLLIEVHDRPEEALCDGARPSCPKYLDNWSIRCVPSPRAKEERGMYTLAYLGPEGTFSQEAATLYERLFGGTL